MRPTASVAPRPNIFSWNRPISSSAAVAPEIPSMQQAGGGSIVNVSSIAGIVSIVGSPNLAYVGSKFASRGMTKHVAIQYGKDNIGSTRCIPATSRRP